MLAVRDAASAGLCAISLAASVVFALRPVAAQQPAPASEIAGEAPEPELEPFLGTYRAADLEAQASTIDEAIHEGTEKMGALRRSVGRKRLHAVNFPVRVVRVSREGDRIVTEFDGDRYVAPASGESQRQRDPEGKPVDVSYRVVGDSLHARYAGDDGVKTISFRPTEDGRLRLGILLESDQLPAPIRYQLAYRRE